MKYTVPIFSSSNKLAIRVKFKDGCSLLTCPFEIDHEYVKLSEVDSA